MLEAQPLKTRLNLNDDEFISNKKSMLGKLDEINDLLDEAEAGGGPRHHERLAARGKLPVRERTVSYTHLTLPTRS